jgi:hypothetical protein
MNPQNYRVTTDTDVAVAVALAAKRGRLTSVRGTNSSLACRRSIETRDDNYTYDRQTIDSAGAFLVGELERLDQRLHMPLAEISWERDIDLRSDVSMADEASSFTNSSFAQAQGVAGSNKAWAGKDSSAVVGVGLDIGKTLYPLNLWIVELSWTLPELASAEKLGRSVDQQKYEGMIRKWDMDVDEMVYVGEPKFSLGGMFNQTNLTNTGNAVNGSWATATPAQILQDVNSLVNSVWAATGYSVVPGRVLMDPTSYGILVGTLISTAGNISILEFVRANSLSNGVNGKPLAIQPCKWLLGTNNGNALGVAATNSMFAYTRNPVYIRYPLVAKQRTPMEYRGIRQITTYFGKLGAVELVYGEIAGLRSNLG